MSAARRAARAGRNLLIALLVGAVIIVAIVVAYVAGRGTDTTTATPSSTALSVSASPTTGSSTDTDSAPTGCLGGAARTNAMLLTAQKSAPHTTYGAVEVATAFYRWSYRYPVPTPADIRAVGAVFVPKQASKSEASLQSDYARNPNPSGDVVKDGAPFYLSTATGQWTAQSGGTASEQLISVQAAFVVDGAVSATESTTEAFTMRWVDGAWRVVGVAKSDPAKVAAGGTAFTAGC